MADIRAFPGTRYDAARVALGAVLAPPYDVLSDEQVAQHKQRSPYNVVHLTRPDSDYAGAARKLGEWEREGVLRQDEPAMYLHEVRWGSHARRDVVAALRLEAYEAGGALPHE